MMMKIQETDDMTPRANRKNTMQNSDNNNNNNTDSE